MKTSLTFLLFVLVAAVTPVAAKDEPIDGHMTFRGTIDGNHFKGSGLEIVVEDDSASLHAQKDRTQFEIPISDQKLSDVVLSLNQKAVAVVLDGIPWPSRRQAIATCNAEGTNRVFHYKTYDMTKELGWIVELGAVSDSGSLVLAKCAFMVPVGGERRMVNHTWVVLRLGDQTLEVVESDSAIEKWATIRESEKSPE